MDRIDLKSISIGIKQHDRNPIIEQLQYDVNKLRLNKSLSSSGVVSNITVAVKKEDGTVLNETVNVGDLVTKVEKHDVEIEQIKENTGDQIWNEVI